MASVVIQGINVSYRDLLHGEEILYDGLPNDEQYFQRVEHPFSDDDIVAIANREHTYTPFQKSWVDKQNYLFDNGLYAFIDGVLTFIPGAYWCYINFWTLEHGDKPDYREDDREFFLFHEYLRLETEVLGVTRLKGRRQGATSIAMFFKWFIAGRGQHKLCGSTSFNDTAAQDNFQRMLMYGFKALLPCFQEDFDSDSENFIRFVKPIEKKKKGILALKREGLNSYIDFKSNAINSYDSGRQSYNVPDEGGKRGSKVNINSYWSRLYKTFLIGVNKVGFAYLPTTVGAKKEGGENYKLFWNNANQFQLDKETKLPVGINTSNRCVQYFVPATRCYAGCIDKFGKSVIDDPIVPVMGNDGRWITEGSKAKILRERSKVEDEQLMEHRRDYPLDVFDAFAFEAGQCEFNSLMLQERIEKLEQDQPYLRKIRLSETHFEVANIYDPSKPKKQSKVGYMDDENGSWLLFEKPMQENCFDTHNGIMTPKNTMNYCIGVDTFRIGFAEDGSKGTICVFKKSCVVNGVETGNYPVALYVGRPRLIQHLYDEVIKACMWYGCKVNFEISAGDFFYGYFHDRGCNDFLYWTPALDPNKRNPILKPGTESASPFELAAQLEAAKMYLDGNDPDNYNGNIHRVVFVSLLNQALAYDHSNRTPYDEMISLMMALLPTLKPRSYDKPPMRPKSFLPTYTIQQYN